MKDKVACFKKQVANITSQDAKEQQSFRTGLLIGDHLAMKISHQAYQSWLTSVSGGSEPMISELPYSNRQIFWMSSLQYSCVRSENNTELIEDKYTPIEFRTMKVLTNVPEFYDDFNCQSKPFLETHGPSYTFL
ncbi:hypothetical protein KQX54_015197 [Cotesia glomerata]|uniref:Peptidase M13 C-terminal domain-containing protein n=1 Tax=Cotesia glomerata TaxID=32391 RepID=A0AAV7IS41_COTGL|nr:hypothetical protein KQX54_015197 [Cotesia glomerata]